MAKTKISEFSATANSNTDINSINIAEGCAPSNINDAIRELMAELKDFQAGTKGDSFNGPVGTTTAAAGAFTTLSASSTVSGTGFSTYLASPPAIGGTAPAAGAFTTLSSTGNTTLGDASGDTVTINGTTTFANVNPTLSAGTANGVLYLNGSKVATSGSALTFDGTSVLSNTVATGTTPTTPAEIRAATSTSGSGWSTTAPWARFSYYSADTSDSGPKVQIAMDAISSASTGGLSDWVLSTANVTTGALVERYRVVSDSGNSIWSIGGSEQMRLTSTGLVINDSARIGSARFSMQVNASTENAIAFKTSTNGEISALRGLNSAGSETVALNYDTTNSALYFRTANTQRMTLDSSGNLGLGVTPSTIDTGKYLEVGQAGCGVWTPAVRNIVINSNLYYNGANKYSTTGAAASYQLANGVHYWYNAPSGTAGNNATLTQAMTLDASGNLSLGTTSTTVWNGSAGTKVVVGGSGNTITSLQTSTTTVDQGAIFEGYATGISSNSAALGSIAFLRSNTSTTALSSYTAFYTNNAGTVAERARITSGGDFVVGKTATGVGTQGFGVYSTGDFEANAGTNPAGYLNRTNDGTILSIRRSGTTVGTISVTTTATAYNTSSDYRLKENIQPMTGALAKVTALKPCTYNWKADGSAGEGFIAHELAEVMPQAVTGQKDAVDAEGNPVYQGIDTSFLVATLTAALQEAVAEINSLKARLDAANL